MSSGIKYSLIALGSFATLIGLIVIVGTFMIMNYWPKLKVTTKNRIITSIFGIIAIGFIVLISLLIF